MASNSGASGGRAVRNDLARKDSATPAELLAAAMVKVFCRYPILNHLAFYLIYLFFILQVDANKAALVEQVATQKAENDLLRQENMRYIL